MKVHPFYICLPPIFATSLAFMLPVATPANAMAFALGHLKIRDMVRNLRVTLILRVMPP